MKRFHSHMMNCKLHTRLMIYFSALVIASMLLVAGISYVSSYRIVEELAESFSSQSVKSVADNLNDIFLEAENLADLVESDSVFQNVLNSPKPENIKEQYSLELQYDFELYRLAGYTSNRFAGIYALGTNGLNMKSHNVTFQSRDFREEAWYQEILEADGFVWLQPQLYSRVFKSIDKQYVAMGRPVISRVNGKRIGIILIEIEADTIEYVLQEYGNVENGTMQILDEDNTILFQKNAENAAKSVRSHAEKDKSAFVFYYTRTLSNGWSVESYIPKTILLSGIIDLGLILVFVIAVMILIALKITDTISKSVINPVRRLIELMDEAEQQGFDVQMHVRYKDELALLGHKFNNMMDFTRHLIAANIEEQESLREAELKALQMQINPHFLYNTLETVIWLIRSGDSEKAISVVTSLSKFFRIGLSRGKNIIPLREELLHVKEYIKIQNTRYKDKIRFSVELEEEKLLECPLPKLVLQPLVENAIYHGIQEKAEGGSIVIVIAYGRDGCVQVSVADDGIGMTEIQVERLRNSLYDRTGTGYALYNTNQRLCRYFGENARLHISSSFGEGTVVDFCIPCGEGEHDKDNSCG